MDGLTLARAYFDDAVRPLVERAWPGMPYAAARIGHGSEVLGLDDAMSRDHDWGPRLTVLLDGPGAPPRTDVLAVLAAELPETFAGRPTRFPLSGEIEPRLHVEVTTTARHLSERLDIRADAPLSRHDWLAATGQAVLEVVGGAVFHDAVGELTRAREQLRWYPDDVWRYVVLSDWVRIDQELPLMGRAADRGDDLGSRVIAARLAGVMTHLLLTLHRTWAPYPKWRGAVAAALPGADAALGPLRAALAASERAARQQHLGTALHRLHELQASTALAVGVQGATVPFWDRPYLQVRPELLEELRDGLPLDWPTELAPGLGSAEQRSDNVDVLVRPAERRRLVGRPVAVTAPR